MVIQLTPLDCRIPKWNQEDLHERPCPICTCAQGDARYIRPDSLNVRICNRCNTFYVSPAPSNRQLSSFYSTYDECHRRGPRLDSENLLRIYQGFDPFSDIRVRELSCIMKFRGSKILDVGFGRARLLYALMKLGATPYGVELDGKAVEFANSLGIPNISQGTLEDLSDYPKFDLIMLNDLIEHPLNPMALLKRASSLLSKGGLLLIWTPNGDVANYEDNPTTFRVDLEHMQYLTIASCIYIASVIKMQVVHLESLGFPWLDGIDQESPKSLGFMSRINLAIKALPGFSVINNMRRAMFAPKDEAERDERTGSYVLFCILRGSS